MKTAVYSGTRNLYQYMVTAAKSLLIHSDVEKIYMLIEDDKLPMEVPDIIHPINVSAQTYIHPDGPNTDKQYFTYMAYIRGALTKIFPDESKILSLDVDTIVDQDISDIWDLPIDDYYFSACVEPVKSKKLGYPYANTGVALYNLDLMRRDGIDDKVLEMVNTEKLACPEQDALSKIVKGRFYEMPPEYNATRFTKKTDNPKIIHYAGIRKWFDFPEVKEYEIVPFKEIKNFPKTKKRRTGPVYMIHACNERMWYVNDYLVPSMTEQGIDRDSIIIWQDKDRKGNLESFMQSMKWIGENENYLGGIWHLQDDVVISKDFKQITEKNDSGIVCGFCNEQFDGGNTNIIGMVSAAYCWFSFQCIRIPNVRAKECADWFYNDVLPNKRHEELTRDGKNDDGLWKKFLIERHPEEVTHNMVRNIVDHIDYLLGGSLINKQREGTRRAYRWEEPEVTEAMAARLSADSAKRTEKSRGAKEKPVRR